MMNYLGQISSIQDNIIYCSNEKTSSFIGEIVFFNNKNNSSKGIIFEINSQYLKILLIQGFQQSLSVNDSVYGTNDKIKIKVGFYLLGKTISPFGDVISIFNKSNNNDVSLFLDTFFQTEYQYISNDSPGIIFRSPVRKPLLTGINSVDCLFPVGLGQRQLIIGDNNTGKTSLALSAILNQNKFNKYSKFSYNKYFGLTYFKPCIYVSIGQKRSEILRIQNILCSFDSAWYTSIVFSSSDDLPIIQYYAPYAGCSMGEWFMNNGYDCIAVYDDLSKHSVAYRQITLLLRRAPGREAFPGDVFFLHSRLLERSAQLNSKYSEGSLTALPIIETLCGDVSSYIPTNVISITDGQLYLNKALLNRGVLPAVDLNLSVSRVGSASQYHFMTSVSKNIKAQLAMYRQFKDAELLGGGGNVKVYINRGKRLTLLFTQPLFNTQTYLKQIIYFYCLGQGFADNIDVRLTKFFLGSIFNVKFYKHFSFNNSLLYLDLFKNIHASEESFSILYADTITSKLYKLLFSFTIFFESVIVPIIEGFSDQNYIWSLVKKYNLSF